MNSNQKLLPSGFFDLIGNEARINQEITNKIVTNFLKNNYQLVKTPLIEFEQTLSNYQKLNEQSFHVPDISSGKNLVFRNDITVQIARLVNTRLKDAPLPLKLCYLGDVLKVDNQNLRGDRQLTQAGVEFIGEVTTDSIKEVLAVTISSLEKINITDLTIEFCLPQFMDLLLLELKLHGNEELYQAIEEKNISKIKEVSGKFGDLLTNLALEMQDFDKIKEILEKLKIPKNLKIKIDNLLKIIKKIKKNYPKITILINIFGDREFFYHKDIGFSIFTKKVLSPIARGGKYQINDNLPAIGSTIYINDLRKILA